MTPEELAGKIDLSLLSPASTKKEIEVLAERAGIYPFATLCIPPSYVKYAQLLLKGSLKISTVIGFPLGYQTQKTKFFEAREAASSGAKELDMVMNITAFKSGDISLCEKEISEIVSKLPDTLIKVIIECAYLTDDEKIRAVDMTVNAGAHFVKTSTGFGPTGATVEDVRLLKEAAKGMVKIKAAGGIKTLKDALDMIKAGADRIGTSKGIEILEETFLGHPG